MRSITLLWRLQHTCQMPGGYARLQRYGPAHDGQGSCGGTRAELACIEESLMGAPTVRDDPIKARYKNGRELSDAVRYKAIWSLT